MGRPPAEENELGRLFGDLHPGFPLTVRRHADGSLAAWYAQLECWDAPAPTAVWHAGEEHFEVAQPPGIGPQAGRDLQ